LSLRVLIVDDDEVFGKSLESRLRGDDRIEIVGRATRGTDALRLTRELAPDVVLMDIAMPGLDGIEATRTIHERDAAQHVVIYTGSDEYEDVARADDAGAAGFLHKEALTSPDLADAIHVLHANYVASVPDPE
jgi:DNA-binding NarL/FixJ family response regulator